MLPDLDNLLFRLLKNPSSGTSESSLCTSHIECSGFSIVATSFSGSDDFSSWTGKLETADNLLGLAVVLGGVDAFSVFCVSLVWAFSKDELLTSEFVFRSKDELLLLSPLLSS
eukprot:NODE_180_length_15790_cov_0.586706.p10 type:complete len:113 gc:universal NODE_180_length_15790_cov_0.586706:2290-1952(-)